MLVTRNANLFLVSGKMQRLMLEFDIFNESLPKNVLQQLDIFISTGVSF
jgi:hypothetical protein